MLRILILVLVVSSCASKKRTEYRPYAEKEGGYQDKVLEDNLRVVKFKANSYTKKELAEEFAKFRAVEICLAENYKLAHLLDSFDKTESRTVRRTSSSGYPSYYYGMSPFYHRYSGFGYGFGISSMSGSSWDETLQYPEVEVVFECANDVYEPQFSFREVSPDDMKHLVKDLRGGLQIERIPKDLQGTGFKSGDIIIRGNGERIQQTYQLLSLFRQNKNRSIRVEVMRDGQVKQGLTLVGTDSTEKKISEQAEIIKRVCENKELKENQLCR